MSQAAAGVTLDYDARIPQLTVTSPSGQSVVFSVFTRVMVMVSVDESNMQRHKIVLRLAEPYIEGVSVSQADVKTITKSGFSSKSTAIAAAPVPSSAMETKTSTHLDDDKGNNSDAEERETHEDASLPTTPKSKRKRKHKKDKSKSSHVF
jgi:hypothetical protein